ncbi:NrfD/PsrC family molybdoenzyme membrane anchor subunit [Desulfitobacterium sp. AusDCA]
MYNWGWKIIIYLFLGGLGAGAYLTSFAAQKGWLGEKSNLGRVGFYLSGPFVLIGSVLLFLDLGIAFSDPFGVLRMFSNIQSVMTWGIYIISLFIIIGFASAYCTWKQRKLSSVLLSFGAILALATGTYTGVLLAVVISVPLWNTFLLPVLFVVSALSTGLAATSLCSYYWEKNIEQNETRVNKIHLVLLVLEVILISLLLAFTLSGAKGVAAVSSAQKIIMGPLAVPFWLLVVAIGLVFPLAYYIIKIKGQKKDYSQILYITSSELSVLLGGLALRAIIVFGAVRIY